jgi:hypothetical protein
VLHYLTEVWDQGNTDVVFAVLAPDFAWQVNTREPVIAGPEAVKAQVEDIQSSIPGIRWRLTSTQQVEAGTPQPEPRLVCTGNDIYRLEAGLIAQLWQEVVDCPWRLELIGAFSPAPAPIATPTGGGEGGSDANRALVLRYYEEVWTGGNTDLVFEILAPDYKAWFGATELTYSGQDAAKRSLDGLRGSIPGFRLTPDIVVAEGEYVAVRWSMWMDSATAPDGSEVICQGNSIYRVAGDVLAEVWTENGCG